MNRHSWQTNDNQDDSNDSVARAAWSCPHCIDEVAEQSSSSTWQLERQPVSYLSEEYIASCGWHRAEWLRESERSITKSAESVSKWSGIPSEQILDRLKRWHESGKTNSARACALAYEHLRSMIDGTTEEQREIADDLLSAYAEFYGLTCRKGGQGELKWVWGLARTDDRQLDLIAKQSGGEECLAAGET